MTIQKCSFPNLPFRDLVYRITFEDGQEPAYISTYNDEITAWTDNAPEELKRYGSYFNFFIQQKLSSMGVSIWFEGINEGEGIMIETKKRIILTECRSRHGYPPNFEDCDAVLYMDGTQKGGCGEPCYFNMRKAGAGHPPFQWKKKLFVEDKEVPDFGWFEA